MGDLKRYICFKMAACRSFFRPFASPQVQLMLVQFLLDQPRRPHCARANCRPKAPHILYMCTNVFFFFSVREQEVDANY